MNRNLRVLGIAAAALVALVIPLNAHATCGTDISFASYYSLITGTTFGPSLRSSFWMVGAGNPALAAGNDNGSVSDATWITPYNGGMIIQSGWAQQLYDGCADAAGAIPAQRMAVAMSDVNGSGQLVYAVGCAHRDPTAGVQFEFSRPGGAPWALVAAPKANITNTVRSGNEAQITVASPDFSAGFYGDGSAGCDIATVIPQYDVYKQQIGRNATPDSTNDVGTSWVLVGTANSGTPAVVTTTCGTTNCDVYLAVAPHYNSNFSTGEPATGAPNRVTQKSTVVQAGPTLAVTPKTRVIQNKKTAE